MQLTRARTRSYASSKVNATCRDHGTTSRASGWTTLTAAMRTGFNRMVGRLI